MTSAPSTAVLDPNFYNLNAFDFGPDGLLYGPIFQEKILKIDVDSGPPPLTSEDILTPFASAAVKFNSQDRLFALNIDRVVQIDPDTGAVEEVAHVGHGLGYPRSTQLGSLLSIHNASIRWGGTHEISL